MVEVESAQTPDRAEWQAATQMVGRRMRKPGAAVGVDKCYGIAEFVAAPEWHGIKAHAVRNVNVNAVDGRLVRCNSYATSLRRRKMFEEAFGWIKTVGGLRKTRPKGLENRSGQVLFAFAAYSLARLLSLMRPAAV